MFEYMARVDRIVDGDTVDLEVDLGFTVKVKVRARLYGIGTPMMKESEKYRKGIEALECVTEWLNCHSWTEPFVKIRSHNGKAIGQGEHGIWLVEIWEHNLPTDGPHDEPCLNDYLVKQGHAVRREY